jgi:hypothetical protein
MYKLLVLWFCGVPSAYYISYYLTKGDLLSYEITCLLCNIHLASAGIIGWFELFDIDISNAKVNPFFGHSDYVVNYLIVPLAMYQFWNSIFCMFHHNLRSFQTLTHHILAFILALCGLDSFLHYWAIYFFGITEISSVPLTIMAIIKLCNRCDYVFYKWCRTLFAITFLWIRVLCWPYYYIICVFQATQYYIDGSLYPPYYFIFTSISTALTMLQLLWGYKIIKNITKRVE